MCNRFFSTITKYASKSDISKRIEFFLEGNKGEIQWKYSRNKPSLLGEIVNPAAIPTYFTERSVVNFYCISIVFPFNISRSVAESISTVFRPPAEDRYLDCLSRRIFLLYYFTKRSGVYFYSISTVFRISYFVFH